MKKLLILALLMLALVITAVACQPTTDEPDTSADDVTTAETPTEAPDTDEPSAPETDPETPAPETDPETPAPDTDEPETPAPDTDEPETPEPETEPPVDPADPVWIVGAEQLNELANVAGASNTSAELKDGYISLTAKGGDPWFMVAGNIGEMPEYMAIRYRTNASQGAEFFIGNGTGPVGGESFLFNYNANGEWNLLIFHLPTVASYMATPTVGYIRYDFYTGGADEGFLDVEYIAFFNTAEYAQAYDFELHKAPHWTEATDKVKHQSFDQLYAGTGDADNGPENVFTPGASADWDFVVDYSDIAYADFTVDTLTYWGWIGFMGEKGQFGYQIDMNAAVYNDEFAFVGGDHEGIIGAAQSVGADSGHRMKIAISIAGLEGEHTVRAMYKTADGMEICLNEFTVKLPARPTHYDNYNVPQDAWTVTGHCPGIVGKEGHANSGMVAAGGVESGALIHQGAVALGEIDLSKYSKVVIMWGCDNSDVTVGHYNNSANNRIMLVSADVNGTAPADGTIIAGGTYELGGWAVQAFEIDLTEVDYNGPVYLCIDTLPGTFALFASVEFIGAEIDYGTEEPEEPEGPQNVVIDLTTIEGYKATNNYGYDCPIIDIGYNEVYLVGSFDLNQYSQIIIEYSYDGDSPNVTDRTPEQCWTDAGHAPIIGFTALDKCFGYANVTNQDAIDYGIYTEIPYTTGNWAAATRTATIEIPANIGYNGPCYLSAYNPWGRTIAVVSITLVPRA